MRYKDKDGFIYETVINYVRSCSHKPNSCTDCELGKHIRNSNTYGDCVSFCLDYPDIAANLIGLQRVDDSGRFGKVAQYWENYLRGKCHDIEINSNDVVVMLSLFKESKNT